jgi:hypothetical protein
MAQDAALPMPPLSRRKLPLEAQETSYFAPSASISSFSIKSIATLFTSGRAFGEGITGLRHNTSFFEKPRDRGDI